jgi:general secretion pathway protein A
MYRAFYGFRERPFDLTSNLTFLCLTPHHEEALCNLEYGIANGSGITLLLGQPGTGKTTILRTVLALHEHHTSVRAIRCSYLTNPRLTPRELFESLAHAFHIDPELPSSKSRFLLELEQNLVANNEQGVLSVLICDEAQSLPDDLLEEVRLLANIETETQKLLRVVLAGQPALGHRLNEPRFRHLKQRIGLRCLLPPLSLRETGAYIAHRIAVAGGDPGRTFSREAVIAIHEASGGIPRMVNVLCENALLTGFAADDRPVSRNTVLEVCRDFDVDCPRDAPKSEAGPGPVVPLKRDFHAPAHLSRGVGIAVANAARRLSRPYFGSKEP